MKRLPFRLKIALLSASIFGLVVGSFGVATWYWLYRQKVEAVDTEIRSLGARHPGWLANRGNFNRFNNWLGFIFGDRHKGQIILLVKDAQDKILYTSPGWPEKLDPAQIDCALADDPKASAQSAATPESQAFGPPWTTGRFGYGGVWAGAWVPGGAGTLWCSQKFPSS
ncbi:MAG: hypothetical protein M1608_17835 [Candidatus Omnitrophica bacterium]|nr:hypothetical protein [Candidatus Omnitrophota bacterium]